MRGGAAPLDKITDGIGLRLVSLHVILSPKLKLPVLAAEAASSEIPNYKADDNLPIRKIHHPKSEGCPDLKFVGLRVT